MKIALINPPHTAIGSRMPNEHLPPLGLLSIAGPLLDDGHQVSLIDADLKSLNTEEIASATLLLSPEIVMIGHSGSSSIHETIMAICAALKAKDKKLTIIYGGVHPTYHWSEIMLESQNIDIIVRGEGERTSKLLINAIQNSKSLLGVDGIVFREGEKIHTTEMAEIITDLDEYRIAWELINHKDYSYWGGKRAVVVQFSRGCPHLCNYCGQRGFWTKWRHRDPHKFAKELARLYREEGVELINFADELPSSSKKAWRTFLEALINENVPLTLVGSTRAGDIVRDKDILHLYKKAGFIRFLLGIETYSNETRIKIQKGGHISEDREAIKLLKEHGIVSMATYVLGFFEEKDIDYWKSYRHLLSYDPDQVQLLYATPHRWTPFYAFVENRKVIQKNKLKWDYKHQVLEAKGVPAWRVFTWFKLIEVLMQLRPSILYRTLFHTDTDFRYAMRWYTRIGRKVWFHEVYEFIFKTKLEKNGPKLSTFMGEMFKNGESSMRYKIKRNYLQ